MWPGINAVPASEYFTAREAVGVFPWSLLTEACGLPVDAGLDPSIAHWLPRPVVDASNLEQGEHVLLCGVEEQVLGPRDANQVALVLRPLCDEAEAATVDLSPLGVDLGLRLVAVGLLCECWSR
jgi:hypothetical protein